MQTLDEILPPAPIIRVMVRGGYAIQKLRIQMGNRLYANFRSKVLELSPNMSESELAAAEKKVLETLRKDYFTITEGVVQLLKNSKFKSVGIISDFSEFCLIHQYLSLEEQEESAFKQLKNEIVKYPIYTDFLANVKGCGPTMSAVIISEIDIHAAKYPSSLHKYCGLDVVLRYEKEGKVIELEYGEGRRMEKHHLVERQYTDDEGVEKTKMSITFKPFLRSKLLGVLAPSFIRAGENHYSKIYYDYKQRLENTPRHAAKTKVHRHRMALRYMIKQFLIDLHIKWRELENLPVYPSYAEGKLGLRHGVDE